MSDFDPILAAARKLAELHYKRRFGDMLTREAMEALLEKHLLEFRADAMEVLAAARGS